MTIGAWVCVLMRPGSTISDLASIVSAAVYLAAIAAGESTSTMSVPAIATAPGATTRCAASCVMTVPPITTSDTDRRAGCAARTAVAASVKTMTCFMRLESYQADG